MSEQVKVPDNVFVNCPENGFQLSQLKKCAACRFYEGLNKVGENKVFELDHHLVCSRPMTRRITKVDI